MSHLGRLEEVGAEAPAAGVYGRGSTLVARQNGGGAARGVDLIPHDAGCVVGFTFSFVRGAAAVSLNVMLPRRLVVLEMLGVARTVAMFRVVSCEGDGLSLRSTTRTSSAYSAALLTFPVRLGMASGKSTKISRVGST
jgi:hypothetical protein